MSDQFPEASDNKRLEALDRLDVLDTPSEESFERIVRLVKRSFGVPVALVSFIDGHRQWYKACAGIDAKDAPLQNTFCKFVLKENDAVAIRDASVDPRVAANPYVVGAPGYRFYIGVPLTTRDKHIVGTLCVMDTEVREVEAEDVASLTDFAQMVMNELELRQLALTDSLTGALSRRAFRDHGTRQTALSQRHHTDLACIGIDLDHFKKINDRFGHAAGDIVLKEVVRLASEELRESDAVGRVGGEEFAALLPNTSLAGGFEAAERLRQRIEKHTIEIDRQPVRITASFGVSALSSAARSFDELMRQADEALYEAKGAGRNRSVPWRPPVEEPRLTLRRVLKGGAIIFNGGASALDCTVRGLSDEGAAIDVYSAVGIPSEFNLKIRGDAFEAHCRVLSRTDKHLEVAFAA